MKKITVAFAFLVATTFMISCGNGNASTKVNKNNLDTAKSRDAETIFKVTNSGTTDLVITKATGSCGCTVPVWPKAPIKPGETGDVAVKFNTSGKPNRQMKTVTLTTNTESGRELLTLRGSVTPKAKK